MDGHEDDATLPSTQTPISGSAPAGLLPEPLTRYDLGPVLGKGGMGEVRLARDMRIDREVAVKLMRKELRGTDNVARFFREARVQGALEHPAVVPVHDLGIDAGGNPYFVMKRLAGVTLAHVLDHRELSRRELLDRLVDVCLAIELAHQRGVIHRDLKPANIMLGDFGETYVLDWGLARVGDEQAIRDVVSISGEEGHTAVGDLLGTPGYMAPEQARGEAVGPSADCFSLGCILFEVLTGKAALPRGVTALAVTIDSPFHSPGTAHPDADVPPELDALCRAATAEVAADRPTARELADRIRAYLDGDRDVAQRRQLAAELLAEAQAALARDEPGEAMQRAARAVMLDPESEVAQRLAAGLALQPPAVIPAAAIAAADAERTEGLARVARSAAFSYVWLVLGLGGMFFYPLHAVWPLIVSIALAITAGVVLYTQADRIAQMRSPLHMVMLLLNLGLLTSAGFVHGPLFVVPVFLVGSLGAFLAQPVRFSAWFVLVGHAVPVAILLACEWTGLTPSTFHIAGGQLHITPWVLDATPSSIAVVFALTIVAQLANTTLVTLSTRNAQVAAQNRLHAHRHHLLQLLPGAGAAAAPASPRSPAPPPAPPSAAA